MSWPTNIPPFDTSYTGPLGRVRDFHKARAQIRLLVERVKAIIGARGKPAGVVPLDNHEKIDGQYFKRDDAGGVAGLDDTGKLPAHRYERIDPGTGFFKNDNGHLAHRRSGVSPGAFTPVGGAIGELGVDEFGHIVALGEGSPIEAVRFVTETRTETYTVRVPT